MHNDLTLKISMLEKNIDALKKSYKSLSEGNMNLQSLQTKHIDIINSLEIKKHIISKLKKTFINDDLFNDNDGSLDFKDINLFEARSSMLNRGAKKYLADAFEKYILTLTEDKAIETYLESIIIEGYTDSSGSASHNLQLSQERAYSVLEYILTLSLMDRDNLKSYLLAKGLGDAGVIKINGIENKEASRRIKIRFKIKNSQIIRKIKRIIND